MSGNLSKPNLSHPIVSELIRRLYGWTPATIKPLPSYDDQNFYVAPADGGEFVLKVMNSKDSKNIAILEVQTHAMTFLHQKGLPVQTVVPTTTGQLMSLEELDCGLGSQKYIVRLLTYLSGITISKVTVTPPLLYEVGKMAARVDQILHEIDHPHLHVLERDKFMWALYNIPLLEPYLFVMDGHPIQEVIRGIIQQYKTHVIPQRSAFRKCINHGDFNDHNLLVEVDESLGHRISGILDFGDMNSGSYVYELAITIMYMMIEHPEPVEVGGPVLAGWESVIPLNSQEKDALYLLVLCRFCQSLVMGRHRLLKEPENEEYLMITSKTGIHILRQLWELGKEEVERRWFQSAARL